MNGTTHDNMRSPITGKRSGIELCPVSGLNRRYVWKRVNFSRFLYDRLEDIHIPEQVYYSFIQNL